ncbi:MAG: hypothetical protein KIT58_21575, partial [Planctomycetota bacterium]|nr:hypothetical protein [Planctomycetota bacterium]
GVRLVARPGEERLVLEGATWVLGREVSLHPTRGALTIGDALFVARDAGGEQGAITFARRHGRVRGTVELRRAQDEVRIVARLKVDYRGVRREVVLRPGR